MEDRTGFRPLEAAAGPRRRDVLLVATGAVGLLGVIGAVGRRSSWCRGLIAPSPGDFGLVQAGSLDVDISSLNPASRSWFSGGHGPSCSSAARLRCLRPGVQPAAAACIRGQLAAFHQAGIGCSGRRLHPHGLHPGIPPQPNSRSPSPAGSAATSAHAMNPSTISPDASSRTCRRSTLPVPPYGFMNERTIRIGENPPDAKFDFRSILQI
jgi:hypothetical protein